MPDPGGFCVAASPGETMATERDRELKRRRKRREEAVKAKKKTTSKK
jgi:hypothetical protein